ncbi:MAG: hypothetical protein AAB381_00480 [Patescibacteria group bacterium]
MTGRTKDIIWTSLSGLGIVTITVIARWFALFSESKLFTTSSLGGVAFLTFFYWTLLIIVMSAIIYVNGRKIGVGRPMDLSYLRDREVILVLAKCRTDVTYITARTERDEVVLLYNEGPDKFGAVRSGYSYRYTNGELELITSRDAKVATASVAD